MSDVNFNSLNRDVYIELHICNMNVIHFRIELCMEIFVYDVG